MALPPSFPAMLSFWLAWNWKITAFGRAPEVDLCVPAMSHFSKHPPESARELQCPPSRPGAAICACAKAVPLAAALSDSEVPGWNSRQVEEFLVKNLLSGAQGLHKKPRAETETLGFESKP